MSITICTRGSTVILSAFEIIGLSQRCTTRTLGGSCFAVTSSAKLLGDPVDVLGVELAHLLARRHALFAVMHRELGVHREVHVGP